MGTLTINFLDLKYFFDGNLEKRFQDYIDLESNIYIEKLKKVILELERVYVWFGSWYFRTGGIKKKL